METYLQTVKEEWVKLINETDPDVHRLATELARDNATPLVAEFYRVVLADPSAAEFLTTEQVERQLQEALRRWLIDVLSCRVEQVEEQMRAQQRAADVHARIGVSVDLVEMGFRVLKKLLLPVITTSAHSPELKLHIYHRPRRCCHGKWCFCIRSRLIPVSATVCRWGSLNLDCGLAIKVGTTSAGSLRPVISLV